MKWFKHETDSLMSEGIEYLIEKEGFAGYGRWNRLLEIVAFKMDKTNRCSVEYPITKWCSLLKLKQKKLISFLELTQNQLKTKVVYSENIIRIEIPNLLKKRDNYTKDLQETCKKLASKEVEVEVDKEIDIKTPISPLKKLWKLPLNIDKKVWEEFEQHRKEIKKPLTNLSRAKNSNVLSGQSADKQKMIVDKTVANGWTGLFPVEGKAEQFRDKLLSEKDFNHGKF